MRWKSSLQIVPCNIAVKFRIIIPYFRESVVCHFDVIFCCIDGVTSGSLASGRLHESICYINDDVRHCSGFCSENRKEKKYTCPPDPSCLKVDNAIFWIVIYLSDTPIQRLNNQGRESAAERADT